MDLRSYEGRAGMMGNQKRDVKKYFFMLPNAVFELGLHVYELAIYAYLLRIEDRRTWQCVVGYPTIADKLGISVNTVAKYVGLLEEHGLIATERTDVITRDVSSATVVSTTPSSRSKTPSTSSMSGRCLRWSRQQLNSGRSDRRRSPVWSSFHLTRSRVHDHAVARPGMRCVRRWRCE